MVVDIGGGTTEVAILSLGGIVYACSVRVGGDKMDEAIINYIRRTHNLLIGESTAEKIKKEIGSAVICSNSHEIKMCIKGRSLINGVPQEVEINQKQVAESMTEVVAAIIHGVKTALENTAPELSADIVDRGIVMTGGASQLKNLDNVLSQATGLPVFVAEHPLSCVVQGTGHALEEIKTLQNVLVSMY